MSDSIRQIQSGGTNVNGITVNTPYEDSKDGVKVEDFLQLMIAQLSNQDFMNPVDDTQYVTQLAQFSTMSAMQELSHYSQQNYVMSLVGKHVTCASYGLNGGVNKESGIVQAIDFSGDEYTITVNGKSFTLSQIMTANAGASGVPSSDLEAAGKMALIQQDIGRDSAKLRWDAPIEDADLAKELRYDIYYSTSRDGMDTLEGVKKGTKAATNLDEPTYTLTGLEPGTTYYVNVVVRNADGEESVYRMSTVKTKA